MRFENIKIGDIVFTEVEVSTGRRTGKCFFIPKNVIKLSPKQFVIEDGTRYRKYDGLEINKDRVSWVYSIRDKLNIRGELRLIYDQTAEMEEFKGKLSLERKIINFIGNDKLSLDSGLSLEDLKYIDRHVNCIKKKLSTINNFSQAGTIVKDMQVGNPDKAYSYKAVSEKQVLDASSKCLKDNNIVFLPVSVNEEIIQRKSKDSYGNDKIEYLTKGSYQYKMIDLDSGEYEILQTCGQGMDSADKGSGKASTYAFKIMLIRLFRFYSGEDTDNHNSQEIVNQPQPQKTEQKINWFNQPNYDTLKEQLEGLKIDVPTALKALKKYTMKKEMKDKVVKLLTEHLPPEVETKIEW
jgi:hypothetical protein